MTGTSQVNQNANSALFNSHYKQVWRKLIPSGLTEAETDFVEQVVGLTSGNSVLDIMCGYGRHTLELARRGYRVTAIDTLAEYIEEIVEKTSEENLSVNASKGDVSLDKIQGKYDAVICMGNSFGGFDYAGATQVLNNISSCLDSGGAFIINSWMIAEIAIKHFESKTWLYVDDYKYLLDNKYLFQPTRIETDHILITPEGTTEVLKGVDYIFTFAELEKMLNEAGFKLQEVYSTPRKRKFVFGDNRAYIVAVKN